FNQQGSLPSVFVVDVNSPTPTYSPRLESYDPVTNEATFLMLDALPIGTYEFHLSGGPFDFLNSEFGIQDYAGQWLSGNDPSGDFLISFPFKHPPRGSLPVPTQVTTVLHNDPDPPQLLGVLFPNELAGGVTITRNFIGSPTSPTDSRDTYQIEFLQTRQYIF